MIDESISKFGRIMIYLRAIRVYKNGDGFGFVWNYWNPLCFFIIPVAFVGSIFFVGICDTMRDLHDIGIGMDPYFIKNPERLKGLN